MCLFDLMFASLLEFVFSVRKGVCQFSDIGDVERNDQAMILPSTFDLWSGPL